MNKTELIKAITDWCEWSKGESQTGEGYQFETQAHNKAVKKDFVIERVKGVKGGLSIRLESSGSVVDGILNITTCQFTQKEIIGNQTGSLVMRGASIDG